jgi:hypothetical protein
MNRRLKLSVRLSVQMGFAAGTTSSTGNAVRPNPLEILCRIRMILQIRTNILGFAGAIGCTKAALSTPFRCSHHHLTLPQIPVPGVRVVPKRSRKYPASSFGRTTAPLQGMQFYSVEGTVFLPELQ